jgi:hypothetical protein
VPWGRGALSKPEPGDDSRHERAPADEHDSPRPPEEGAAVSAAAESGLTSEEGCNAWCANGHGDSNQDEQNRNREKYGEFTNTHGLDQTLYRAFAVDIRTRIIA